MLNYYCVHFEIPADTYYTCRKRADDNATTFYNYVNNGCS